MQLQTKHNKKYPIKGNCVVSTVVYQATVSKETETKKYLGSTEGHYYNHNKDFRNIKKRHSTTLAEYICTQKLADEDNDIKSGWSVTKVCNKYQPGVVTCALCLSEKTKYA